MARAVETRDVLGISTGEEAECVLPEIFQSASQQSLPIRTVILFHLAVQFNSGVSLMDIIGVEVLITVGFDSLQ